MKMLTRDSDHQYLLDLNYRLEENGIPSVIQGENTARMIIPLFLLQPTLWVCVDEQFEDAVQLMENSSHVVKSKIDMEALYSAQPTEAQKTNELNAALLHLLFYMGAIMLGMFAFIKALEWL
ncbi:MAG: DUF2007 domain-containing protein [Sedimenticola sp.]